MTSDDPKRRAGEGSADKDFGQKVREDLETARSGAGKAASDAADSVKHEVQQDAELAVERTRGFADQQKNLLAEQLKSVAMAVDKVSDELDEEQKRLMSRYIHDISERLNKAGDALEHTDLDSVVSRVNEFGRRRPGLFLGAAALAGFAASRFLTSSSQHGPDTAPAPKEVAGSNGSRRLRQDARARDYQAGA